MSQQNYTYLAEILRIENPKHIKPQVFFRVDLGFHSWVTIKAQVLNYNEYKPSINDTVEAQFIMHTKQGKGYIHERQYFYDAVILSLNPDRNYIVNDDTGNRAPERAKTILARQSR